MALNDNVKDVSSDDEENLVFHYKRDSYRDLETPEVRNLASGVTKTSPGLFKALVNTRGNRIIFFTLLAVTAFTFIYGLLEGGNNQDVVSGVSCYLSAFSIDDQVYASLEIKQSKKSKEKLPVNLDAVFTAVDTDGQVSAINEKVFSFDRKDRQFVRASFSDYEIGAVKCSVSDGKKTIELISSVEKK